MSRRKLTNWKKRGVSKAGALKAAAEFDCSANWILSGVSDSSSSNVSRVVGWDSSTPLDSDETEIPFYKDVLVSCGSLLVVNECLSPFRDLKWILLGFVVFPLLFLQTFVKVSPAFLTAS